MAIATFYHANLNLDDKAVNLTAKESSHAVKSRRLRAGEPLCLINGQGLLAQARIEQADARALQLSVQSIEQFPEPKSISIAVAAPKGDRQRSMIDQLTQLGVRQIIPLQCDYSVSKLSENMLEKWRRIAIGACKQSQNPWLPVVQAPVTFAELLKQHKPLIYADMAGNSLANLSVKPEQAVILIGPEGGFSENEFTQLKATNAEPFKMANSILRTELAAVAAAVLASQ